MDSTGAKWGGGGETSVMAQVKVIHDVTLCIYKINCDKPVSKWSFQTKLEEQQNIHAY